MKTITTALIFLGTLIFTTHADAQFLKKLGKKAEKAVERGIERTVERRAEKEASEKTDDAIDKVLNKKDKNKNSKGKKGKNSSGDSDVVSQGGNSLEEPDSLTESGSNEVGFERGSEILFTDDFSKDAVGDFPARWNTNLGGEVKKLKGFDEKFLKVPVKSSVNIELTKPLPDNFTLEFDLIIPKTDGENLVAFGFFDGDVNINLTNSPKKGIAFLLYNGGYHDGKIRYGSDQLRFNETNYAPPLNQKIHVALEVNNHRRIRMFIDGDKYVDLPTKFKPGFAQNFGFKSFQHIKQLAGNDFYVSNVVIAQTGVDERSSVQKDLLEKGTFVTSDITFASGSDQIDASSANILDEIGDAMKGSDASFAIIGHTDSDGSESTNQTLSEKRAQAVKSYLVSTFGIDADRLEASGKGESEPVASNDSPSGKAQNRRVEFVKR